MGEVFSTGPGISPISLSDLDLIVIICYLIQTVTTRSNEITKKISYLKRQFEPEGGFPLGAPRSTSPPLRGDTRLAKPRTWRTGHESRPKRAQSIRGDIGKGCIIAANLNALSCLTASFIWVWLVACK